MDQHGAVVLQQQQPGRLGQEGVQPAGVGDLAAGDDEAHGLRTLLADPDMSRQDARGAWHRAGRELLVPSWHKLGFTRAG